MAHVALLLQVLRSAEVKPGPTGQQTASLGLTSRAAAPAAPHSGRQDVPPPPPGEPPACGAPPIFRLPALTTLQPPNMSMQALHPSAGNPALQAMPGWAQHAGFARAASPCAGLPPPGYHRAPSPSMGGLLHGLPVHPGPIRQPQPRALLLPQALYPSNMHYGVAPHAVLHQPAWPRSIGIPPNQMQGAPPN